MIIIPSSVKINQHQMHQICFRMAPLSMFQGEVLPFGISLASPTMPPTNGHIEHDGTFVGGSQLTTLIRNAPARILSKLGEVHAPNKTKK